MSSLSNRVKNENLEAGDHIYSWRNFFAYAHHVQLRGKNFVHIFTLVAGLNKNPAGSGVACSCLACFKRKGSLYRFEYGVTKIAFKLHLRGGTCTTAESDPKSEVLHRANYLFENGGFGKYSLFRNNCEDFTLYCKTGLLTIDIDKESGRSGQIADLVKMLPKKIKAKYFSHCVGLGRYGSDVGVRDDVIKVPVEDLVADNSTQDDENDHLQDNDNATQLRR
ncbi:hypothetical protein RHGRI_019843 [Rhododendron griersonianum]|uniref:LRAT domain-containing protein n=1 Tax=Rhododendron griersonianum TaxID=479676 RepID=A0AAV6JFD2_9ERIC|nr:hypothetical protein RHGRI_019843 [Rhododendron griersonianum]